MSRHNKNRERVDVLKRTTGEWHPNKPGPDGKRDHVQLSLVQIFDSATPWRVCVWGNDDLGVERDFVLKKDAVEFFNVWNTKQELGGPEELMNAGFVRS